jgi:hypothetical protein
MMKIPACWLTWPKKSITARATCQLTRGDGGQNLIGNEQSELLGLIRTQELLAARKVDGAEQFFTRANDFGFFKRARRDPEDMGQGKSIGRCGLGDTQVQARCDDMPFPNHRRGGHGHHTSSAILAQEAFSAAADPKRFPNS